MTREGLLCTCAWLHISTLVLFIIIFSECVHFKKNPDYMHMYMYSITPKAYWHQLELCLTCRKYLFLNPYQSHIPWKILFLFFIERTHTDSSHWAFVATNVFFKGAVSNNLLCFTICDRAAPGRTVFLFQSEKLLLSVVQSLFASEVKNTNTHLVLWASLNSMDA